MKYIAYATSEENGQKLSNDIIANGGTIESTYGAIPELIIFSGGSKTEKFWLNQFESSNLKSISRDSIVSADTDIEPIETPQAVNTASVGWHFNAINYNKDYKISSKKKVNVYVLDTGIEEEHEDFFQVEHLRNPYKDDNGHGTHVGGLISSKKHGIDNDSNVVNLFNVKVLGEDGNGSLSRILDGLAIVLEHHKTTDNTSIVNMSLSARGQIGLMPAYYVLKKLQENGIIIVASAGNNGRSLDDYGEDPDYLNGTDTFPAEVHGVLCVASSTYKNTLSTFSNFGGNCRINAPGSSITSTYINNDYATMSGTSMATPIVAGSLALMMSQFETRPQNEDEANVFVQKFIDKFTSDSMVSVEEKMHTPLLLDMTNISDILDNPDFENDPTIDPSPAKKRFYHSIIEKITSIFVDNKKMAIIAGIALLAGIVTLFVMFS